LYHTEQSPIPAGIKKKKEEEIVIQRRPRFSSGENVYLNHTFPKFYEISLSVNDHLQLPGLDNTSESDSTAGLK
jgi:hypothetical protein